MMSNMEWIDTKDQLPKFNKLIMFISNHFSDNYGFSDPRRYMGYLCEDVFEGEYIQLWSGIEIREHLISMIKPQNIRLIRFDCIIKWAPLPEIKNPD